MKDRDKQAFAQTLTAISELYGKEVSAASMRLWWNCLEHYSLAKVQQAFSAHAKDPDRGQWMPKPADIVRQIDGGRPNADQIIAMALNPTTPLGVLCRIEIGSWHLGNWTAEKLRPLAESCIQKLPEWQKKIDAGELTRHERDTIAKYTAPALGHDTARLT